MDKSQEKLEALFQAAVALETEAHRAEYLSRACPDPELRREVESLLASHDHPDAISGRTHEIQRLIGRALRSVVNLSLLGERTIWKDCDVYRQTEEQGLQQ